jgi:hypothetical protein
VEHVRQLPALTDAVGRHLLRGDVSAAKSTVERSDTLLADVYRVGSSGWSAAAR